MHNAWEFAGIQYSEGKNFDWLDGWKCWTLASKNVRLEESYTRPLRNGGPLKMLTIPNLIKINVLMHQFSNLMFNLHYMCLLKWIWQLINGQNFHWQLTFDICMHWPFTACTNAKNWLPHVTVSFEAVFRLVTQRSSPKTGEERCVKSLKTAAKETVKYIVCKISRINVNMETNKRQKGPFSIFCNLLTINLNSNTISYPSTSGVSSNICRARCIIVLVFGLSSFFPSNKAQGTAMTITSTTTTATPIKINFRFIWAVWDGQGYDRNDSNFFGHLQTVQSQEDIETPWGKYSITLTWYLPISLDKLINCPISLAFIGWKNTTKESILDYSRYSVTKSNSLVLLWEQQNFSPPPPHFPGWSAYLENKSAKERMYIGFFFVGYMLVVCLSYSSGRSARAASDQYLKKANEILDETPLVDGWVFERFGIISQKFIEKKVCLSFNSSPPFRQGCTWIFTILSACIPNIPLTSRCKDIVYLFILFI